MADRLLVGDANGAALGPKCLQGIEIAQMGPNTLRNNCMSVWVTQSVPQNEVLRHDGHVRVLPRLKRHVIPWPCSEAA